jgi:indolepyruvate ferredoxin oxidoreductase
MCSSTRTWRGQTSPLGGVLALCGDDPQREVVDHRLQSEFAMIDAEMPVLAPATIQEVLDYGMIGWELSRYSGLWVVDDLPCGHDGFRRRG